MTKVPCRFTRVGYKHEGLSGRGRAILEDLLRDCSLKRYKKEVLELPEKVYENIYLQDIDKKLVEGIAIGIAQEKKLEVLRFNRHFMSLQKALAVAKAKAAMPFFTDKLGQGTSPFVVFTTSLDSVDCLASLPHARVITGKTSVTQRSIVVDAFQAGNVPVLVCTIAAAGVGLTLTRADTVYFIDRDFSIAQNRQAEDRLHRIGQKNQVTVVDFLSEHPQEERLYEILVQKTQIIETVEDLHAN
jgi:SWI/SNF-related matrix-associated actin-dependent regulator 1 of chromatin subfamily A